MEKKNNWQDFKEVLDRYNIKKLYHFTDRDGLHGVSRRLSRRRAGFAH